MNGKMSIQMMADYYRKAPKKKEALDYLAETNDCTTADIKRLLSKRGIKFPGRVPVDVPELPPIEDDIPVQLNEEYAEVPETLPKPIEADFIKVVTPEMIKSKAFGCMVEFFNEDAPKEYMDGFLYGVSFVLGMM